MNVYLVVKVELIFSKVQVKDLDEKHNIGLFKMDLELTRVDYTIIGITDVNCLQLLPSLYPKEQQRVRACVFYTLDTW